MAEVTKCDFGDQVMKGTVALSGPLTVGKTTAHPGDAQPRGAVTARKLVSGGGSTHKWVSQS